MPIDFDALKAVPRILIEAQLKPVAGTRIQPTGFPDLGAAYYEAPVNGELVPTLLVESAQSMANRLESVCWDEVAADVVPELSGLPYVSVRLAGLGTGEDTTCSLLEFHRLNSPYIMNALTTKGTTFADTLKNELGFVSGESSKNRKGKHAEDPDDESPADSAEPDDIPGVVNLRKLASVCFKYDPNSLVHGIFLEKIAGRLRHPRALSAFIEANHARRADSGGVKFDRVLPKKEHVEDVTGIAAKSASAEGYVNVPFHRTEFTAGSITAFFLLDLAQIRGYGLDEDASRLLIAFSLWKVRRFLDSSMHLRSACELELVNGDASIVVKRPIDGFAFPGIDHLSPIVAELIGKCRTHFADPVVTQLTWSPEAARKAYDKKQKRKRG